MFLLLKNIHGLILHNKIIQGSILCIASLALSLSIISSFLAGFIVLGHYFLGLIVCSLLLQHQSVAFPLILDFTKQWTATNKASKDSDKTCNICSGSKCRRYLKQDKTPWKSIRVKKKLNDAIERLFNTILSNFIESWYCEFTTDATFVSTLRNSIRYSLSLAANKIIHLDTGRIISNVLIPSAIRHIDDCLSMERIARLKNIGIEQVAISYLGDRLHIAATNRKREVEYLRQLSSLILPTVMPTQYMRCGNFVVFMRELLSMWTLLPLMDVLADPNVINQLIIITANVIEVKKHTRYGDFKGLAKDDGDKCQDIMVEILCNFGEKRVNHPSPFALELKCILKDTDLLYAFMQYLKKEDMVHLLQFCLNLEEFNSALLRPDLKPHQLTSLHKSATDIYNLYIAPTATSMTHIGPDRSRADALRHLLAGGPQCIVRLRTSEPLLFAAADHVYAVLERDWLNHFFHSAHFYRHMSKRNTGTTDAGATTKNNSSLVQLVPSGDRGTVARISSGLGKIKGALAVRAPVVGAPFCNALPIQIVEAQQDSSDMNTWLVSIPTVVPMRQLSMREQHKQNVNNRWLFHIEVETKGTRQDVDYIRSPNDGRALKRGEKIQWHVLRKEQDFDTLNERVTGVLSAASLDSVCPLRAEMGGVDERRLRYERWLRHLLAQHRIIPSHLLHTFLTTPRAHSSTVAVDKAAHEAIVAPPTTTNDLETIYQSVALRLRKEKGQHLDASFMAAFLTSTGQRSVHRQCVAADWAELSDAMDVVASAISTAHNTPTLNIPNTLHNHVFNDNFGLTSNVTHATELSRDNNTTSVHPHGLIDSIFYLLKHVFKVRPFCLRLFAALCSLVPVGLQTAAHRYIDHKIRTALSQDNLTYLVTQLQDVIFTKRAAVTSEQLEERKRDAFKCLSGVFSDRFAGLLSSKGVEVKEGAAKLLDILQNPHLNKHLVYNLFDLILIELYPDWDKCTSGKGD